MLEIKNGGVGRGYIGEFGELKFYVKYSTGLSNARGVLDSSYLQVKSDSPSIMPAPGFLEPRQRIRNERRR
jgi:hypothetical protein